MTREAIPFAVPDLSQFARTLGRSLKERHALKTEPPGHVELLNLLARAGGHRNIQSLRATVSLQPVAVNADEPQTLTALARKTLGHFDARGRLAHWPQKFSVQQLAMWPLWTLFDARRVYTEREVNEILKAWHSFGDHATLRRELINHRLLERKPDCSEYRKLPRRPDAQVRWLLNAWRARARGEAGGRDASVWS